MKKTTASAAVTLRLHLLKHITIARKYFIFYIHTVSQIECLLHHRQKHILQYKLPVKKKYIQLFVGEKPVFFL